MNFKITIAHLHSHKVQYAICKMQTVIAGQTEMARRQGKGSADYRSSKAIFVGVFDLRLESVPARRLQCRTAIASNALTTELTAACNRMDVQGETARK